MLISVFNYIEESLNIDNSLDNLAYEIKVELLFIKKKKRFNFKENFKYS